MKKMLIIGGTSPGGIGETIGRQFVYSYGDSVRVDSPRPSEVDVTRDTDLFDYVSNNGPYDFAVYAAGIASLQWIDDFMPADPYLDFPEFTKVYDVNVFGFLRLLTALKRTQADGGRILAIVSDAATTPMRGSMAYCTSKAALSMAVRCAAREMGPEWCVNGLSPSAVEGTPMSDWIDKMVPVFRGWEPEQARSYEVGAIPKGRRVTTDEVAAMAVSILTGPDFLTGSIIQLTGGK